MAEIKCTADGLSEAIITAIEDYGAEVSADMKAVVKEVANECKSAIQNKSPTNSGGYKRGWKVSVKEESSTYVRGRVYNAKKPGLAHLLENGHAKVNGGRVEGRPHIAPAEEKATESLVKKMKEAAKR